MDFKKTVKEGYNAIADRYLAERTRDSEDVRLLHDFIERLSANAKLLDAGCGAGIPISQMLSEHFDVTGVDFSEAQIELAKKNVPNAKFLCEDMTKLNFPENTFRWNYFLLRHHPYSARRASVICSRISIECSNRAASLCSVSAPKHLIDDIDENYLGTRMYWSHYDTETYLKMLNECGFSIIWSKRVADETCEGAGHLFVFGAEIKQ